MIRLFLRKKDKEKAEQLKPCPFCGGYAHLDKTYWFQDNIIYCEGCESVFALNDLDLNSEAEEIVNAWNRRENDNRGRQGLFHLLRQCRQTK